MTASANDADRGTFRAVFERSRVPMALMDRDRRYFAINDAHMALFKYRREEIIGRRTEEIGSRR